MQSVLRYRGNGNHIGKQVTKDIAYLFYVSCGLKQDKILAWYLPSFYSSFTLLLQNQ